MRSLWISILSLAILIGCWGIFYQYSDKTLDKMINECEETVMPAILNGDWDQALDGFEKQYDKWHRYKKYSLFFTDTSAINDCDASFAKTLMYIKAEDDSNSSGELLALKEQLTYLQKTEKILLENIF